MFIFYSNTPVSYDRPVCTCGIHLAWSRSRLRMLNDSARNNKLMAALTKVYNTIVNIKCHYEVILRYYHLSLLYSVQVMDHCYLLCVLSKMSLH